MDAQIYRLDDMRSRLNGPESMEQFSPQHMASAGLALTLAAMSFWVEYAGAMALFHHRLVSQPSLPSSK
jgi:hypothetical protein